MQTALILTPSELTELISPVVKNAVIDAFRSAKTVSHNVGQDGEYLTLKEAAKYLKISRPTFIALRKSGAFKAHPVGNRHLFLRSDLDAYVQSKYL